MDQASCNYCTSSAQIFAARSALVQVVLNNYDPEGVFTLRTGSKNNSPIKASFLFKNLVNNPNAVVESDEQPPCNLARWQIATIIGVFGWLMCVFLFFTRTRPS